MKILTPVLITNSGTFPDDMDLYLISGDSNNIQITLPDITADGIYFKLYRVDTNNANTVTIVPFTSSQLINGAQELSLPISANGELVSLNNIWYFM